jgi:mannose-6-phosphate isomerase-like protein (cupin superfamily)
MVTNVKRPEWEALPFDGCRNVEGKVLLDEPGIGLAMLRFEPEATIHEHAGVTDCWVVCIEGRGLTSVGGVQAEIEAGQKVFWPNGVPHRLWTAGSMMTTLMVHPLGFEAS